MTTCPQTGKRVYVTAPRAYRVIADLCRKHKARASRMSGHLAAYRCACCHQWHVGHGGHQ